MAPQFRERSAFAWTLALYGAAFALLAWPWLSGRVTIPWDAKAQFQPQVQFLATALAAGESPFWTPNIFAGWPQIADPQSLIFSPFHLLLAALTPAPSLRATDAVTFAYLFVGGLGIMLFFRDRGWHAAGALVAALAFAFGGSAASRLQHAGQIISLAYLPLALWLLARTLERASWRAGLAAGAVIGMMAIERDQVALLGLYLLAGFAIAHWLGAADRVARIRATLVPVTVSGVAALCVAVVPLVMTALLAADSNRPAIDFVSAGRGSLHPAHLLMLVFGDLYGAADPAVDFWGPPSFEWKAAFGPVDLFIAQNVGQIYAGILAPVLVLGLGLARGLLWSREIRFFTIALACAALYALGWYTPVFRLMYELVPGVALFRRPADATFVFGLLLAICAGYLVHRWLTDTVPPSQRWQRIAEIMLAAAITLSAVGVAVAVGRTKAAMVPLLSGVLIAVGAIGILALARRANGKSAVLATVLLAGFMTVDLAWNNGPNESTGLQPSMYDALRPDTANETVAFLKAKLAETAAPDRRDRVELIGIGYHWPNLSLSHGLDHVFGHNPLRLRDFARATGVGDTVAVPEQRTFAPLFPSYRSAFADLFGLRLIATGVPVEQIDRSLRPGDLTLLARTKGAYIYENPRALPRVTLVGDYRLADFDALMRSGWPDVDPRQTVLLEQPPGGTRISGAGAGAAKIARYANTEVVVEVDAPGGGFLVLNDVWHPWWRAEVDGHPTPILKANVLFRAVAIEPGRHRVRFIFSPFAGALDQLRAMLTRAR